MSGTTLRWVGFAEHRQAWWDGFSGSRSVAWVELRVPTGPARWSLEFGGGEGCGGAASSPEAAREAAEAAWSEWCRAAGLAAVPEWRPIAEAPRDGTTIMAWGDGFPFAATVDADGTVRDLDGDEVDIYPDEPPTAWWMPMPLGPSDAGVAP